MSQTLEELRGAGLDHSLFADGPGGWRRGRRGFAADQLVRDVRRDVRRRAGRLLRDALADRQQHL